MESLKIGGNIQPAGLVTAVEQASDAVVVTDTNGNIQYVNPAFTKMTGYTSDEAVGRNPRILKSGCHDQALYRDLWLTIRQGGTWHVEIVNRRKDGTLYHEEMRINPVTDEKGHPVSFIAFKRDVTDRRAAEQTQALLAAVVENSSDGIVAYGADGTILSWNRGAEVMLGYTASEAIGKHVSMVAAPERRQENETLTMSILKGEAVSQYESVGQRKGGHPVYVSVTLCPIRNAANEVTAISSIVRDVSEHKAAELDRAKLASIVESSGDAIISGRLDGTIVSWNAGAEALFGYSRQEMIGHSAEILSPPEGREEAKRRLIAVQRGETPVPIETVRFGKDGRPIDVSVRLSPIRSVSGEVAGYSAIYHDTSLRILARRKLQESEERFRGVFEHAPFGMCVTGLDGRFFQVNHALCEMLGYSQTELLAIRWTELIHVDDREPALDRIRQLLREPDGCLDGERRYIHRNGSVVWGRVRVSLVRDANGDPQYFVTHAETSRRASGPKPNCVRAKIDSR